MVEIPRPRQCRQCLNWGFNYSYCGACTIWSRTHTATGSCRRCRHVTRLNAAERLCRPCLRAIRTERDFAWLADPDGCRPRDRQLSFILPEPGGMEAQPLSRTPGRAWDTARLIRKYGGGQEKQDDPAFCPPVLPGQMLLFTLRRVLGRLAHDRIRGRVLRDWDQVEPVLLRRAADRGHDERWVREVGGAARVLLAVRESDGGGRIPVEALEDLAARRLPVAEVLQQAGLLDVPDTWTAPPELGVARRPGPPGPHSCRNCQAWGMGRRCPGCRGWEENADTFDSGDCTRCKRERVLLRHGLCRGCCLDITLNGQHVRHQPWRQLMLGSPFTLGTAVHSAHIRHEPGSPGFQSHWKGPPKPERTVSEHRLMPGQQTLFPMPRDWSGVASLPPSRLPALTSGDKEFISAFVEETRHLRWRPAARTQCLRTLRVLASWLGTDAPIPEEDVRALAAAVPHHRPGPRLAQFLAGRGRLVPAAREDPDAVGVHALITEHTGAVAGELHIWVKVLRGGGRWEHPATTWTTIRHYLGALRPVLVQWQAAGAATLREISQDDVRDALNARTGHPAETFLVAARSLFRALKQERVIFTDPTRGLTAPVVKKIPRSLPPEALQGAIDRTPSPAGRLIVALVAVHALGLNEITRLPTSALDLSAGRLIVRRPGRRHLVYLDELTYELAAVWMRERHRRWPMTGNPHLIVNQITAVSTDGQPISRSSMKGIFAQLGLSGQKVRIDRLFHEAQLTADALHLTRLFGISEETAVKYVHAAHPERTGKTLR